MITNELPVAERDAAQVLRPGLVGAQAEDRASDLAGAQLLPLGGNARKASTSPSANSCIGLVVGLAIQSMSLAWVEPDLVPYDGQEQTPALAELLADADALALQVADGLDRFVREQLVATGMHSGQCHDRLAGIDLIGDPCRGLEIEVDFAPCDRVDR